MAAWITCPLLAVAPLLLQDPSVEIRWSKLPLRVAQGLPIQSVHPSATCRLLGNDGLGLGTTPADSIKLLVDGRVRRTPKGGLEVDEDGVGEDWRVLKSGKAHVVEWFFDGRTERLQFFERDGDWWACSANLLETTKGDTALVLLDANADGDYFDPSDLIRFGDGTFRPVGRRRVVDSGTERWLLRLDPGRGLPRLRFAAVEPLPDGTTPTQRKAYQTANRLRNQQGFGPARYSVELSKALTQHTAYLQHHDPNKEGTLTSYMGEEMDRALYSEAGDSASRGGSVTYLTDRVDTESHIRS
ncbi:MAG: hypothetical protein P8R43_06525, partial [Planctomycetota bacterium]|nr:hypothetical protein [Planctomycetota bacterium]